jgi:pilus assembly protein Flp/PilA
MSAVNTWLLKAFARFEEQRGQTMAEYGLILAVIAVVAVGAFILLGGEVEEKVSSIAGEFDQ